jgi:TfoX/Sxy family transcriptional regulator of competence genes
MKKMMFSIVSAFQLLLRTGEQLKDFLRNKVGSSTVAANFFI